MTRYPNQLQALSLQLRLSPFVDELALYDRGTAAGVAVDLSHIPVKQVSGECWRAVIVTMYQAKLDQIIKGYKAIENGLQNALTVADIVIVTPGPFSSRSFHCTHKDAGYTTSVVLRPPLRFRMDNPK